MNINFSDFVALAKAGYTADQINKLAIATMNAAAPAPAPVPAAFDPVQELLKQFAELKGAVQANAVQQSAQPPEPTAEQILAEIIDPPIK